MLMLPQVLLEMGMGKVQRAFMSHQPTFRPPQTTSRDKAFHKVLLIAQEALGVPPSLPLRTGRTASKKSSNTHLAVGRWVGLPFWSGR